MAELERVIGKKLFEATWSDYAHPYLIQTFLISVLIAVILEAYLTKKYISKNEVGKRFVLMAMCMGIVIGGIYPPFWTNDKIRLYSIFEGADTWCECRSCSTIMRCP